VYSLVQQLSRPELVNFVDGMLDTAEGLVALATHIRDWNCFKRTSPVAQTLLAELLDRVQQEQFAQIQDLLPAILAYSAKHFRRAELLYAASFQVEHLLNELALLPLRADTADSLPTKRQKLDIS
jgi:hypothetical protein